MGRQFRLKQNGGIQEPLRSRAVQELWKRGAISVDAEIQAIGSDEWIPFARTRLARDDRSSGTMSEAAAPGALPRWSIRYLALATLIAAVILAAVFQEQLRRIPRQVRLSSLQSRAYDYYDKYKASLPSKVADEDIDSMIEIIDQYRVDPSAFEEAPYVPDRIREVVAEVGPASIMQRMRRLEEDARELEPRAWAGNTPEQLVVIERQSQDCLKAYNILCQRASTVGVALPPSGISKSCFGAAAICGFRKSEFGDQSRRRAILEGHGQSAYVRDLAERLIDRLAAIPPSQGPLRVDREFKYAVTRNGGNLTVPLTATIEIRVNERPRVVNLQWAGDDHQWVVQDISSPRAEQVLRKRLDRDDPRESLKQIAEDVSENGQIKFAFSSLQQP